MAEPRRFRVDIGDVELSVLEWAGSGDPVLLLHATGFHSHCWQQVVQRLQGQHVYAVDLRFHGASGNLGEVCWQLLAQDIRQLIEQLDLQRVIGVGHSVGGYLIARAAAMAPQRFRQLLLIDPVIFPLQRYTRHQQELGNISAHDHPVSRRKNRWQDAEEMYQRFHDREPFSSWDPLVLRDYCDYALRPVGEEGYLELQCDPINEASMYLNQGGNEAIYRELPQIQAPTTVLRAPAAEQDISDFLSSPTWPGLAGALPCARDVLLPEHNHFIPMQDPALVAGYIIEALTGKWP